MRKSIRILTVGPDQDPLWVRLYVQPIGERWAAMIVGDTAHRPGRMRCEARVLRGHGRGGRATGQGVPGNVGADELTTGERGTNMDPAVQPSSRIQPSPSKPGSSGASRKPSKPGRCPPLFTDLQAEMAEARTGNLKSGRR